MKLTSFSNRDNNLKTETYSSPPKLKRWLLGWSGALELKSRQINTLRADLLLNAAHLAVEGPRRLAVCGSRSAVRGVRRPLGSRHLFIKRSAACGSRDVQAERGRLRGRASRAASLDWGFRGAAARSSTTKNR